MKQEKPKPAPLGRETANWRPVADALNRVLMAFGYEFNIIFLRQLAETAILASTPAPSVDRAAIIEECAKVADVVAEKHEIAAKELFKRPGEFEVRAARDAAYDIAEGIRSLAATEGKT